MKIREVLTELLHVDGQTYMTKLAVAFRKFSNAPKNNERNRNTSIFVYIHKTSFISRNMLQDN